MFIFLVTHPVNKILMNRNSGIGRSSRFYEAPLRNDSGMIRKGTLIQ